MGTSLPYRPRTTRPRGVVSGQAVNSSPRVRSFRKEFGHVLKSRKILSVIVVSGCGGGEGVVGVGGSLVARVRGVGRAREEVRRTTERRLNWWELEEI